jgi:hypothetical protein
MAKRSKPPVDSGRLDPLVGQWAMPDWMERYRQLISNTGGNSVESLMNDHTTTAFSNVILAGMIVSVDSQVKLLMQLHEQGLV